MTNDEHVCNEREQDTAEQARCMTHEVRTYQTGRQVMVRAVRGARSVISSCDKRKESAHVGRTGAMSEGRMR